MVRGTFNRHPLAGTIQIRKMNIVTNPEIREELIKRWKELDMKPAHVIKDAEERGIHITASRMSNYINGKIEGAVSQYHLHWLCTRYCVFINFNLGKPQIVEGKLKFVISKYNELEALSRLNKEFGTPIIDFKIEKKVKVEKKKREPKK